MFVLLLGVLGVFGTHDVRKGVILHDRGEAVIVDEYALIKLNVSLVHENEKSLSEL